MNLNHKEIPIVTRHCNSSAYLRNHRGNYDHDHDDEKNQIFLPAETMVKVALFAEKLNGYRHNTITVGDTSGCTDYVYSDYFRDLSKVTNTLKYILDINNNNNNRKKTHDTNKKTDMIDKKLNNRNAIARSRNLNGHNDISKNKLCIYVSDPASRLDKYYYFWNLYQKFVLCLLFGNYEPYITGDIINLLCQCLNLNSNNENILNDYIRQFKQCLNYFHQLLIQSIKTGSSTCKQFCRYINKEFVRLFPLFNLAGRNKWDIPLMQVIATALDLPKDEQHCKLLFE